MDLSIRHQIRHTKSEIKEFTEMVDEFRTKNVCSLEYRLFLENYFRIIYIVMQKCYYEGSTVKLCRGSWDPTFKV